MKIIWSPKALRELENCVRYIYHEFGKQATDNFYKELERCETLITNNPEIAYREPLLENKRKIYRSIIVRKHSKLVYFVENNIIYIADLWDTRREPKRLSQRIK